MDPELKQALSDMERRIDKRFETLETRIEATETKLLTAFPDWAFTYEVRAWGVTTLMVGFEEPSLDHRGTSQ